MKSPQWKWALLFATLGLVVVAGVRADDDPTGEPAGYAVPDGDEAELLAFIEQMQQRQPQGQDRGELIDDFRQIQEAVVRASEKLLGSGPSDEGRVDAARAKLASLMMLARLGDPTAQMRLRKFSGELRNDPSPELQREASFVFLNTKASEVLSQGSEEELDAYLREVNAFVMAGEPDMQGLRLAFPVAQALEQLGHTQRAKNAYLQYAEFYSASDDEQIADIGRKLHGAARRLDLVGNKLDLKGTQVDGTPFDWSAYEGKVVLVDFWATWCGPCRAELPNVVANYERFHDRGFEVVGISLDENRHEVEDFLAEQKLPWVNLFSDDPEATGWNHPMAEYYGITSIPAVILVDRDGTVLSLDARGEALGAQLEELLGDETP